jgi:photosystem II stability/assembly factor-like uncharacterized protein
MKFRIAKFLCLCFVAITAVSCGKDDDSEPTVTPETRDSLGVGWEKVNLPDGMTFIDIFFPTNDIGYGCTGIYVAKSTDGGLTWTKFNLPSNYPKSLSNIFFLDANTGWVIGSEGSIRTTDGGKNWQLVNNAGGVDIQLINHNEGFLTTIGSLRKTTDGGQTWVPVGPAINPIGLFFFDNKRGWITNAEGYIYYTEDGGQSYKYSKKVFGADAAPYVVQFTDSMYGWIAGAKVGSPYNTRDGGNTWNKLFGAANFTDVHFFDNNNGIVMIGGRILKTRDGGTTFQQTAYLAKGQPIEIHFTDPDHGWATGSDGVIYRYRR